MPANYKLYCRSGRADVKQCFNHDYRNGDEYDSNQKQYECVFPMTLESKLQALVAKWQTKHSDALTHAKNETDDDLVRHDKANQIFDLILSVLMADRAEEKKPTK